MDFVEAYDRYFSHNAPDLRVAMKAFGWVPACENDVVDAYKVVDGDRLSFDRCPELFVADANRAAADQKQMKLPFNI